MSSRRKCNNGLTHLVFNLQLRQSKSDFCWFTHFLQFRNSFRLIFVKKWEGAQRASYLNPGEFQEQNSQQITMNNKKRISSKGVIDIIMILAMIGCWASTDTVKGQRGQFRNEQDIVNNFSWGTLHSILSIVFTILIIIHISQNWKFIKGIIVKKLYSKNIVSTLTFITFAVTLISFLLYLTGFSHSRGEFHGTIANIFLITGSVHLVLNFKKLMNLIHMTLIAKESWMHSYLLKINSSKKNE
jgi:hypothetical protein